MCVLRASVLMVGVRAGVRAVVHHNLPYDRQLATQLSSASFRKSLEERSQLSEISTVSIVPCVELDFIDSNLYLQTLLLRWDCFEKFSLAGRFG